MTELAATLDGYGDALRRLKAVCDRLPSAARAALSTPAGMAALAGPLDCNLTFSASDCAVRLLGGLRASIVYAEQVEAEFKAMAETQRETDRRAA